MEYSRALSGHQPTTAADLLRHRVGTGRKTTESIIEWVHNYARMQENYAQELERMLRRTAIDDSELGTLATPWNGVASIAVDSVRLFTSLSARLRSEVEQPLHDFLADEWTGAERAVSSVASGTSANTESIDNIQVADTARLASVKESLLKFHTMLADVTQALSKASERGVQDVLGFEPSEEVDSYVAQVVAGAAAAAPEGPGAAQTGRGSPARHTSRTSRRQSSMQSLRSNGTDGERKSGIRAKVGSIFGRRKKQSGVDNSDLPPPGAQLLATDSPRSNNSDLAPPRPRPSRGNGSFLRSQESLYTPIESPNESPLVGIDQPQFQPQQPAQSKPKQAPAPPPQRVSYAAPTLPLAGNHQQPLPSPPPGLSGASSPTGQGPAVDQFSADSYNAQPGFSNRAPQNRKDIRSALFVGVEPTQRESSRSDSNQVTPDTSPTKNYTTPKASSPDAEEFFTPAQQFQPRFESNVGSSVAPVEEEDTLPGSLPLRTPSVMRTGSLRRASLQRAFTGDFASSHPPLPSDEGFVATVKELMTVKVVDGAIVKAFIEGEINGVYNGSPGRVSVRLAGSDRAEVVSAKAPYLTEGMSQNVYDVDGSLFGAQNVTLASYSGDWTHQVPVIFAPVWRIEENQSRLMLSYSLPSTYPQDSVVLHNLMVTVMIAGGQATSAQSKPIATFSKEKQRVTWRFSQPVELRRGKVERLLCQFSTLGPAREAREGIEVRFMSTTTPPAVRLDMERGGQWVPVPQNTSLFISSYSALSE